jgi:hypothetical protein
MTNTWWWVHGCSLRGFCAPCEGKFHVDGFWKRVTYLLYLNEAPIVGSGGNLQLLTSALPSLMSKEWSCVEAAGLHRVGTL